MSELENIENSQEVEVIPTDNTTEDRQSTGEVSGEVTEPEDNSAEIEAEQERLEQERLELERQEAEERAREQARIEHENFLNSFPDTTVFYRDLLVKGNVKSLGTVVRDPHIAEQWGFLDNHFDESELTYVGTPECGIWYLKGYEKPESTIEELKARKLAEISAEAHKYSQYECGEMYLTSSKGFRINADHKSQDNIRGLIALNTATAFKDFDNQFHQVSVDDLNTMLTECYVNGSSLYQQKFEYESRVDAAKSAEDLYFDVIFLMADFSAK